MELQGMPPPADVIGYYCFDPASSVVRFFFGLLPFCYSEAGVLFRLYLIVFIPVLLLFLINRFLIKNKLKKKTIKVIVVLLLLYPLARFLITNMIVAVFRILVSK